MQRAGGTASSGYFTDSVADLLSRLRGDDSPQAAQLIRAGEGLMVVFRAWMNQRPSDQERVARIRELFEYNRAVLDYLMGNAEKARSGVRETLKK